MFRTEMALNIFKNKYANPRNETWEQRSEMIVNDVCGDRSMTAKPKAHPLMSDTDLEYLTKCIKEFKFLPGGRYIYYAGRPKGFFNNCLDGETRFLTDRGWKTLKEEVGNTVKVFSPVDGSYKNAVVKSYGTQKLNHIVFGSKRGVSREFVVRATRTHHWMLADGTDTYDLRIGDVVMPNSQSMPDSGIGYLHGIIFGDGSKCYERKDGVTNYKIRCCCSKAKNALSEVERILTEEGVDYHIKYHPSANGDPTLYFKLFNSDLKELPDSVLSSNSYKASFIKGWLLADGHEGRGNVIASVNKRAMEFFEKYAPLAGIIATGHLRKQVRDTNFKHNHALYFRNYCYGDSFSGFKVKDISYNVAEEVVYCIEEPQYQQFVIQDGITTMNCFAFGAEEDSREEWARITHNACAALMSGGGIGVDYSVLRPSGSLLRSTGGIASGPIPLMRIVNEVGRNVMQGGSRRSAIYASLNWLHGDIQDFIHEKEWSDEIKRLKGLDFNFNAPMDQTNMSVNYDDRFLDAIHEEWDYDLAGRIQFESIVSIPATFRSNIYHAMSSGEPGFSFNFGKFEKETLRNACSEFITEHDSDVCNLGSINFGRIANLDELRDVVNVASKFLICGSLRSELPTDKCNRVREEHRKIGLGIMGLHEWLLQRGYSYEVTPELTSWLEVWKDESERAANSHADRFYISRPERYRAIAPSGTISIIAGTTSGIEPLFASAYKRRYLENGSTWKYEYVIEPTAKRIIDETGIDPDSIEDSFTLAKDPEKRIKFQYEIQKYVDMGISSTLNLPSWGSEENNEDKVDEMASIVAKYAHGLRGLTFYPQDSRGGQPLTKVPYEEAAKQNGVVFTENEETCKGGVCGI